MQYPLFIVAARNTVALIHASTVCFDDYYDAEAAVRGRDGVMLEGARLRVEMSRGGRGAGPDRYDDRRGGGGYYDDPPPRAPPRNLRVGSCEMGGWS